jgi:hypothetical protein
MHRIRIDATNLILVLLAGIITLLSSRFPADLKEIALLSGGCLLLVTFLRTIVLGRRPEDDKSKKPKRRENVTPTNLKEATDEIRLRQAIKLIQSGDKDSGRNLLLDIVASNPANESAWLWLASVAPPDKRTFLLEKALSINPNHIEVKRHLEKLKSRGPIPKDVADDRIGKPSPGSVWVFVDQFGGAKYFKDETIPLDGRKYKCDGLVILNNGTQLRAKFNLIASKEQLVIDNVLCFYDGLWYPNDADELFKVLHITKEQALPMMCLPDRNLSGLPGPFLIGPSC